jgi:glycerate kinase
MSLTAVTGQLDDEVERSIIGVGGNATDDAFTNLNDDSNSEDIEDDDEDVELAECPIDAKLWKVDLSLLANSS